MPTDPAIEALAALAHRLWCERMQAEGWRYGPRFDEAAMVHDALVPFERLSVHDRRAACLAVEAEELPDRLAAVIDYGRGPDRELTVEEMREGLEVGWAEWIVAHVEGRSPDERGRIISWETDPKTGLLRLVRVEWEDGEVAEYLPSERELRRLAPEVP